MSIGGSEFLIIAVVALFLFGPSLLAFWFGYILGQKKREAAEEPGPETPAEASAEAPAHRPSAPEPQADEPPPSPDASAVGPNDTADDAE